MVVPPTPFIQSERVVLRDRVRAARAAFVAALGAGEHLRLNAALVGRLRPLLTGRVAVAGYAAMHEEIDPADVGYEIWPRVVAPGAPLCFHRVARHCLVTMPGWGLREPAADTPPATPDAILVPLVAADAAGNRLGYGKGYYDRTLPLHGAVRIGVGFDCQLVEHVPSEPWDAALDWLVTPTRTLRCPARS